jgi:molecular chaperone HscB
VSPDPFDTLGLRPDFDLDLEAAGRRHLELSKALHPDRFTQSPKAERRQALGRAIEVNEAWRLLRDPVRRAEALLARLGLAVEENREPKPDPDLLMEMMELREALSDAGQKKDEAALDRLVAQVEQRQEKALSALSRSFSSALSSGTSLSATESEALLRRLGELRYLRRFLDEAVALQDELF